MATELDQHADRLTGDHVEEKAEAKAEAPEQTNATAHAEVTPHKGHPKK